MKNQGRKARWAALLKRYEKHQGSIRSFCKQEGISEASFYQWRKKLRQEAGVGFVELRAAPAVERQGVVVSLVNRGVEIGLPPDWAAEQLAAFINALQVC